jgi:hypothetical protein
MTLRRLLLAFLLAIVAGVFANWIARVDGAQAGQFGGQPRTSSVVVGHYDEASIFSIGSVIEVGASISTADLAAKPDNAVRGNAPFLAGSDAADAAAASASRGMSDLGGIFSSEENAARGTVWTSAGNVSQNDVAGLVNGGMYRGDVNILSGVHGLADGTMAAERAFYEADVARSRTYRGSTFTTYPT